MAGIKKTPLGVQNSHDNGGKGDKDQKGEHDARELDSQIGFTGNKRKIGGKETDNLFGEINHQQCDGAEKHKNKIQDIYSKFPGFLLCAGFVIGRKNGDKGSGQSPLGKEISKKVRYPERDNKGIIHIPRPK